VETPAFWATASRFIASERLLRMKCTSSVGRHILSKIALPARLEVHGTRDARSGPNPDLRQTVAKESIKL